MATIKSDVDFRTAPDDLLLARFCRSREEDAFAELVRRHESMVLGIARQMLVCQHAAEDVFQATFLVLARDAAKIRDRRALTSWLYGVAYRISARLAKERAKSSLTMEEEPAVNDDPLLKMSNRVEKRAVHDELNRLPDKLRSPILLRYFGGRSNTEVAATLGVSEAAVEGRLKRGRSQLRLRLARRGIGLASAAAILKLAGSRTAVASPTLVNDTIAACLATDLRGQTFMVSENVTQLAKLEMVRMTTNRIARLVLISCVAVGTLSFGWALRTGVSSAIAQQGSSLNEDSFEFDEQEVVAESPFDEAEPDDATIKSSRPSNQNFDPFAVQAKDSAKTDPQPTSKFDMKVRAPAEQRIVTALGEPTRLEFSDTPLTEVVEYLEQFHNLTIELDNKALDDISIDASSETVNLDISGVTLKSALRLMLRPLDLEPVIADEVLLITSADAAENSFPETHVYQINHVWSSDAEALVELIVNTVAPHTWSDVGGPGTISAFRGGIAVRQSQQVHEELAEFLDQLERLQSPE